VSTYSYGGGSSYGTYYSGNFNAAQNVFQSGERGAADGTIALGKISVTAAVTMSFRIE